MQKTFEEQRLEKLATLRKSIGAIETKANEAMTTGQDGYGQDFVPTDLASYVLETVRNADTLMSKLPTPIVMPSPTYTIPVEWADPTWYATSEQADVTATAVTTSKAGTSDIVLTAKKFSTSVYASGELDEDSIINIRSYLGDKFAKSYGELLDNVILNGDTETGATGNVNMDDQAPTAWSYFLHLDGVRKSALTNSKDVNAGTLDVADIRSARALMGIKGVDPKNLVLAMDLSTYYKILGLGQVETIEKFGGAATIVNGVLKAIDGIEILATSLMGLTEADGKKSYDTPANNTLGQAVLIYKPDMLTGFRRNLSVFTEYLPQYDQYRFTGHVRFALKIRSTDSCAMIRNITV